MNEHEHFHMQVKNMRLVSVSNSMTFYQYKISTHLAKTVVANVLSRMHEGTHANMHMQLISWRTQL